MYLFGVSIENKQCGRSKAANLAGMESAIVVSCSGS
jgi:hypothetical protein